jgi:hypothetical protein
VPCRDTRKRGNCSPNTRKFRHADLNVSSSGRDRSRHVCAKDVKRRTFGARPTVSWDEDR